jgi:hypothetical protein
LICGSGIILPTQTKRQENDMKLQEIKDAVTSGKAVCWATDNYDVIKSLKNNQYYIVCNRNQSTTGLTWRDGITLNGKESEFYIK